MIGEVYLEEWHHGHEGIDRYIPDYADWYNNGKQISTIKYYPVISPIVLAGIISFYPLTIGSFLQPEVYRIKDRTTVHQYFENRYIFTHFIDNLVICLYFLLWFYISIHENKISRLIVLSIGIILAIGLFV